MISNKQRDRKVDEFINTKTIPSWAEEALRTQIFPDETIDSFYPFICLYSGKIVLKNVLFLTNMRVLLIRENKSVIESKYKYIQSISSSFNFNEKAKREVHIVDSRSPLGLYIYEANDKPYYYLCDEIVHKINIKRAPYA